MAFFDRIDVIKANMMEPVEKEKKHCKENVVKGLQPILACKDGEVNVFPHSYPRTSLWLVTQVKNK